jgi:lipoate-protein ligase A
MFLFQQTFSSPAENLACDEALLDTCENSDSAGFLRFWEAESYFVVLGFSKRLAREVYEENCADLQIPIFRRVSGGGTVLQGPGCLSYTLILPISKSAELETITGANRFVMERNHAAIAPLTRTPVALQGHTDLTMEGRKFSGNAQRRKRRSLLFHGSFLLNFDLKLISKTLRIPVEQPEYRNERAHGDFLVNLALPAEKVAQSLRERWGAQPTASSEVLGEILKQTRNLAEGKYADPQWNRRF